jgi:hypothetical protein
MGKLLNNKFSNINASMSTNSNYSNSYSDYARNTLQEKINSDFLYAADIYDIEEEISIGALEFQTITVRIVHILKNNIGIKVGDDFKELIFSELNHIVGLGLRYRFDDNIWLTINSDYYHYPTISVVIRRCNNVLRWRDIDNSILQEPCIIDYKINENAFDQNDKIIIPEGDIQVIAQYNDNSKKIRIDDRFIFGDQAFRVRSINNFINKFTYDNESPKLLYLTMTKDNNSPYDNTTTDVSNSNNYVDGKKPISNWGKGV